MSEATWAPPTAAGSSVPMQEPVIGSPPPPPAPAQLPPGGAYAPGWQSPMPAVAPPPVAYGVVYCRGCGQPVNPQAAICVNCGVPTALYQHQVRPANPKTKSTSVVLAVLFGLFAWLYTYQKDSWKFWLNLALAVLTLGIWGIGAWIWAIIDTAVRPSSWYEAFPNG